MKHIFQLYVPSRLPLLAGAAAVVVTAAFAAVVGNDFDDGLVSAGSTLSNPSTFVGATFYGGTGGVTNPPPKSPATLTNLGIGLGALALSVV